jgi:Spy/CpxP family protein refolding chaperone
MSENRINENVAPESRRSTRKGFWVGIIAGGLVGALAGGALISTAGVSAASIATARAFRGHFGGRLAENPERAKEHVELATDWVLSRVDATDAQKAQAKEVADRALDALVPLTEQHRANREELAAELAKTDIDATAIERIRQSEVGLVDDFSRELTSALTEIAQTLTPEQRNQLIEEAQKFHR